MLDFEEKDQNDDFAQYFQELCIIIKTPEKSSIAKVNYVYAIYYKTLEL